MIQTLKNLLRVALIPVCLIPSAWASDSVATVIFLKGKVSKKVGDQLSVLKESDPISEGTIISTGPDSAVKLLLKDKSQLSMGPESSARLDQLKPQAPGAATLLKGQVRSKVEPDPAAAQQPAKKPKFFIRTSTATMGVRGTDFQVVYNPENKVTSLVTFEGGVSMVKTEPSKPMSFGQLEGMMNGEKSVLVTSGNFSSANPQMPQATIPTKLSPSQFETLKVNDPVKLAGALKSDKAAAASGAPVKGFSPIPPGVDAKAFVSSGASIEQQIMASVPKELIAAAGTPSGGLTPHLSGAGSPPPPEGFYNKSTGAFAPPAGGFLDLHTGLYVPPPPGSAFDPNTGVFVPPPGMGQVDAKTGSYIPPAGFQLDATKGFVAMNQPGDPSTRAPGSPGGSPGAQNPQNPMMAFMPSMPAGMMPGMMPPGMMPPGFMPGGMFGSAPPPPPPPQYDLPPPFPVADPYCPTCAPYLPPPPPPSSSTTINFAITVN